MVTITRSKLNKMARSVIDKETGMTEYDLFENQHCYEDWNIIEDVKENKMKEYIKLAQGVVALVKIHHADEHEIAEYLMQYVNMKGEK